MEIATRVPPHGKEAQGGEAVETSGYVEYSETSLTFKEETPYEVWQAVVERLLRAEKSIRWWIGDAIRFGERKYGEMYTQAVEETPYSYRSLTQYVYVADHVESSRRLENLSFGHHDAVASLEPAEQEEVLKKASEGGWSVRDTREAAREVRTLPASDRSSPTRGEPEVVKTQPCPHCNGTGEILVL